MNVLDVKNLKKTYRSQFLRRKIKALDGIDFSVNEGEIFGLLGPNGAGKTTIFKSILGLIKIDEGEIKIFGDKIDMVKRERIGFLPENPYFYRHLTGYEILDFYSSLFKKRRNKEEIKKLLEKIGLEDSMERRIGTYSKGMLQRIGFAQAIINEPDFIILDEPMTGLDPIWRKEMKEWIIELKREGKTIIFSTHILPDVEEICDTVGIIYKGKILKTGKLSDILQYKKVSFDVMISGIDKKKLEKFGDVFTYDRFEIVKIDDDERLQELLKFVLKNKGKIISVEQRKKKLEDYFIEVLNEKD
uniref:ABC transporter ATP-binding protein n=1 Tax=candidate division WOR-3 bacterium TaxID=2052148 RepID=A0A7C4U6H9_UNCW3